MKIDLVGPFPPPYGGVSVHLERLVARLLSAGHEAQVHAPQQSGEHLFRSFRRFWRECRGDVVHFHVTGTWAKFFMGALAMSGRPVILTAHGSDLETVVGSFSPLMRTLLSRMFRNLHALVAVNEKIAEFAIEIMGLPADRVHVIPAFLAPDGDAMRSASPDPEVQAFIDSHGAVLCANAFDMGRFEGELLYGADLLVDLLDRARRHTPDTGLVLYISIVRDDQEEELRQLRMDIAERGLSEHFHIVTGSRPFGPTLARSTVMIRPTATDGDALSVREALWLGIPVVASDVVVRPEGTHVFPYRSADALWDATRQILERPEESAATLQQLPRTDPFDQLLVVYQAVGG